MKNKVQIINSSIMINSINHRSKKLFLLLILITGFALTSVKAQDSIEGKWKDDKKGTVILIFEEEGKYYGELISAEDPKANEKIKEQGKIILLKDFEKEGDNSYCCGKIYQPKKKKSISAKLVLEDENTLKLNVKAGPFKKSRTWIRLDDPTNVNTETGK